MSNAKKRAYQGKYILHKYTAEQIAWLQAQHGKNRTTIDICAEFNQVFQANQTVIKIRSKLKKMGVNFQSQFRRNSTGFMSSHYKDTGKLHPREKPIGTIRQRRDGLEIKIANLKGQQRKNWIPLAKHIYQQANQVQVAKDELVFHIDGNPLNNELNNLILIKRRDIGAINHSFSQPEHQNLPPEMRKSLILMTRITQTRQAKTGGETTAMRINRRQKLKKQQKKEKEKSCINSTKPH